MYKSDMGDKYGDIKDFKCYMEYVIYSAEYDRQYFKVIV
jgi:hypothetical protein